MFLYGKYLTDHELQGPPEDHLTLYPCLAERHSTDKRYNLSLDKLYVFSFEWGSARHGYSVRWSSGGPWNSWSVKDFPKKKHKIKDKLNKLIISN